MSFKEVLDLIMLSMVFVGILGLTYLVTRKLALVSKKTHLNKNMEIIEVMALMQGQYLYIVRAGKQYHLVSCSQKGNITYLREVEGEDLQLEEIKTKAFQEYVTSFMKGNQKSEEEEKINH